MFFSFCVMMYGARMINPIPDEDELDIVKKNQRVDDKDEDETDSDESEEEGQQKEDDEDKYEVEYEEDVISSVLSHKKFHFFFVNQIFTYLFIILLEYSFTQHFKDN